MPTPRSRASPRAKSKPAPSSPVKRSQDRTALHGTLIERAARHTLAANPLIGVRRREVLGAATALLGRLARQPDVVTANYAKLLVEYGRIATGRSKVAADQGDRRFADPAWEKNALFRRVLQSYVALGNTIDRCVDDARLDPKATERARFAMSLVVDALSPTNFLASNPAALHRLVDTRGASALRGVANLVEDAASGRGLPRQVDARPYTVGRNLANTPGAVVYRNELLELIQYRPTTAEVHARPLLIVPPQINKFYVFDLQPGKSLVRFALDGGVQTFAVSWRNPTREHADWGFDAYTAALEQAIDAMREITGARDVNVLGACSGGIALSALLGYLAAGRDRKVHSATISVCVLDTATVEDTTTGLFVTPATIAAAKAASRKRGVVEGNDLARMFAWMRPNDLVWNYVVNNYLLGNEPPAHEILYWNNDSTRLPAQLHADFLDLFRSNAFARPGALRVRGRRIDIGAAGMETYVVVGLTDHITPWHGVYRTARLFGGARSTFVLSNGGHIQSLVNPPATARSWFMAGPARAHTADGWLKRQQKSEGSWWPHWRTWIKARSGSLQRAEGEVGTASYPALAAAPGTYVLAR